MLIIFCIKKYQGSESKTSCAEVQKIPVSRILSTGFGT